MIANVNDKPVPGALCINCKTELNFFQIDTNKGKQVLYNCANENCPRKGNVTTVYFPPAETAPAKPAA
jgi:hypothetical protein